MWIEQIGWGAAITALAGILAIVGAVLSALDSQRQSGRIEELIERSTEANRETLAYLQGDGGIPVVDLQIFDEPAEAAVIACRNNGVNPLRDLRLVISNMRRRLVADPDGIVRLGDMWKDALRENVGTLHPKQGWRLEKQLTLETGDEHDFNVFSYAGEEHWIQEISLRRVDGRWRTSTRVRFASDMAGKPLYERTDAAYPRNSLGQPDVSWR